MSVISSFWRSRTVVEVKKLARLIVNTNGRLSIRSCSRYFIVISLIHLHDVPTL